MKPSFTKNSKVIMLILLAFTGIVSFLYIVFFQLGPTEEKNGLKAGPYLADKGEISLLSIGDSKNMQSLTNQLNEKGVYPKISQIIGYTDDDSLERINRQQPLLELEKEPAYIVFDSKGLLYKTYSYDDLVEYLITYPYE